MLKDVLRNLRESKNIPQSKVAEILNVSPAAYSTYEMGTRDVSSDKVVKLAKFYGVTTDYLYGIENDSECVITLEERGYLKKYRQLDDHGKDIIDTILDKEYERCREQSEKITQKPQQIKNGKMMTEKIAAFGGNNSERQVSEDELRKRFEALRNED